MGTSGQYADVWLPDFAELSGSFGIFSILGVDFRSFSDWPTLSDYDRLAAARGVVTAAGQPVTFVRAVPKPRRRRRRTTTVVPYESQVLAGQLPTRIGHWHDFFNMLCWCLFPRAKAALNDRQVKGGAGSRTAEQNLLAMFDEGGVIRAVGSGSEITMVFGHALHEGVLRKQTGLNGCLTELTIPNLGSTLVDQVAAVDIALGAVIAAGKLTRTRSSS